MLFGQNIPDTIFVEPYQGDSLFLIAIGTFNRANTKLNVRYLDQVFDSVQVAEFAYNRISRNEERQQEADLIKLEADALTRLYGDVNGILNAMTGGGYLVNAFQRHFTTYIGYYKAQLGQSVSYLQLKANGTAVEVDTQGNEVQGGFSGTWDIVTDSRWRLKNFFPANILPDGAVYNRIGSPPNEFRAVGSNVVITKVRATATNEE